jgi:hypothetical protein
VHRTGHEARLRFASHTSVPANSPGQPWRSIAIKLCISSFIGPASGLASVSIGLGCTMLIVIPRGPRSRAPRHALQRRLVQHVGRHVGQRHAVAVGRLDHDDPSAIGLPSHGFDRGVIGRVDVDAEQAVDRIRVLSECIAEDGDAESKTITSTGPLSCTRAITASRSALSVRTVVLPVSAASSSSVTWNPHR